MISALRFSKSLLLLVLFSAASAPSQADALYEFAFSSATDAGHGELTVDGTVPGLLTNTVLAVNGWVDITGGLDTGLYATLEQGVGPGFTPGFLFNGDNVINFNSGQPLLDGLGLLFSYTDNTGNSTEVNLFESPYWTSSLDIYSYISGQTNQNQPNPENDNATFNLTLIPEPASLALLGLGFSLLGLRSRKPA